MQAQLGFDLQRTEQGRPVMTVSIASQTDPLGLMRALKSYYPEMWQQVNLEIIAPHPATNPPIANGNGSHGKNRILGVA